jgi:hypothetical protein
MKWASSVPVAAVVAFIEIGIIPLSRQMAVSSDRDELACLQAAISEGQNRRSGIPDQLNALSSPSLLASRVSLRHADYFCEDAGASDLQADGEAALREIAVRSVLALLQRSSPRRLQSGQGQRTCSA